MYKIDIRSTRKRHSKLGTLSFSVRTGLSNPGRIWATWGHKLDHWLEL